MEVMALVLSYDDRQLRLSAPSLFPALSKQPSVSVDDEFELPIPSQSFQK